MKTFKSYLKEQKVTKRIEDFIDFATEHLGLEKRPNVILLQTREPEMTTASYDLNSGDMKILHGNRAVFDVCRSIAHEMVHQKQHQEVEDPSHLDGSTGSPHENEANAVAGQIIRLYGKKFPEFYDE